MANNSWRGPHAGNLYLTSITGDWIARCPAIDRHRGRARAGVGGVRELRADEPLVTLRLTPALGGTLGELMHGGFERIGGDVGAEHAGYETGWGMTQLNALRELVGKP